MKRNQNGTDDGCFYSWNSTCIYIFLRLYGQNFNPATTTTTQPKWWQNATPVLMTTICLMRSGTGEIYQGMWRVYMSVTWCIDDWHDPEFLANPNRSILTSGFFVVVQRGGKWHDEKHSWWHIPGPRCFQQSQGGIHSDTEVSAVKIHFVICMLRI